MAPVFSTSALHTSFAVRSFDRVCHIRCKNLALNIRDCRPIHLLWGVVAPWFETGVSLRNLRKPFTPKLHTCVFRMRTMSAIFPYIWCPLPGEVKYPTQAGKHGTATQANIVVANYNYVTEPMLAASCMP